MRELDLEVRMTLDKKSKKRIAVLHERLQKLEKFSQARSSNVTIRMR